MKKLTPAQHNTLVEVAALHNRLSGMYIAAHYKPKDALLRLGYIRSSGRSGEDHYKPTMAGLEYLRGVGVPAPEGKQERKKPLNRGLWTYRFKDNPEERRFAEAWEEENQPIGTPGRGPTLAALLNPNQEQGPINEPTPREREVAATVIQWLGSPVGQCFLRDLGYTKKEKA